MSDKTYVLSLSADTFNAFKMDFDSALQRLLQKMDRLQSDSASINCKISVALTPAPERNFDATREGDTVQVMKPSFSHEISTEIKVKDKTTGNLSGNRKLVWDEELMEYVMKDIDDGQTSLFDTAQSRQNAASPVEQEPPQLPEGIVDVDYTVISDDKGYILRNPDKVRHQGPVGHPQSPCGRADDGEPECRPLLCGDRRRHHRPRFCLPRRRPPPCG